MGCHCTAGTRNRSGGGKEISNSQAWEGVGKNATEDWVCVNERRRKKNKRFMKGEVELLM